MNKKQEALIKKKLNVLVVEDDETTVKLYKKLLLEEGYDFVCVSTGQKAITKLNSENFDLVCLDLKLPDINGIELLQNIKDKIEWTPTIIVTANPSLETSMQAINAGIVTEYVVKPFSANELILALRSSLSRAKLIIENKRLHNKLENVNSALVERVEQLEAVASESATLNSKVEQLTEHIKTLEDKLASCKNKKI